MFMLRYIRYYVFFLLCCITCYVMLCFAYFLLRYNMLCYFYGTLYNMLSYVI